jgi:hypothetical protein
MYVTNANGSVSRITQIQISDPTKFNTNWCTIGLNAPRELVINGGYMYVTNANAGTISKIDMLNPSTVVVVDFVNGLTSPQGLVIHNTGTTSYGYVVNNNNSIAQFDMSTGNLIKSTWAAGLTNGPVGLVSMGTYIYLANSSNASISKLYVAPDGSCYNEGTKILCLNKELEEQYIPIENLRKGDLVKTYKHGFKKINLIGKNLMLNDPTSFGNCMYKMEKTLDNGLFEDLFITGWHSLLVDDLGEHKLENDAKFAKETPKIEDKHLLLAGVSNDFTKVETTEEFTYYHFVLESDDVEQQFGVWANGILSESTSEKNFLEHSFILL